ncbi:DUF3043 domain-containing protein [Nocardioides sp. LML1-1-1.1]|uniref:DUF3043 domain-containing protein n=1 Tax=Nocardioides sp. LML1-1-1.1 TaxID=3135248 RepID=UPI00341659D2
MFKRTKAPVEETTPTVAKPGGKGRPTPTRKEAEAAAKARARAPRDKREMSRLQREHRTEQSRKIREGIKSGDESYLPARDKGRVRRFIRDWIDRRFSIIDMLMPLLLISLILGFAGSRTMAAAGSMVMMIAVLFVIIDMVSIRFRLRRELKRRFPEEPLKGTTYYALTRAMQMKFMRIPKSRVKIGQALPEDYHR